MLIILDGNGKIITSGGRAVVGGDPEGKVCTDIIISILAAPLL
jgi:hypothetical protein